MTKEEQSLSKTITSRFNKIDTAYKGNVESYLEIANMCADALVFAEKEKFNITDLVEGLVMSKTNFYRFAKIGKAKLKKVYGDDIVSQVTDYNLLEMMSSMKVMENSESGKNKRDSIKNLITSNVESFNRDTVKEIINGATDTSKDKKSNIDTNRFNKVVASIRVNSQSFVSIEDIEKLNNYIAKLNENDDFDFDVAVEVKDVQKSLENSVKEFNKWNDTYSQRFSKKVA